MNQTYLEKAKERIPNVPLLINVVSRRVRQLNQGQQAMVRKENEHTANMDVALQEIAEGKLTVETVYVAPQRPSDLDSLISL